MSSTNKNETYKVAVIKGNGSTKQTIEIPKKDCKSWMAAQKMAEQQFIENFPKGEKAGAKVAKKYTFKYQKETK